MLYQIPTIALVLLNLIVVVYVVRERGRSKSGIFLLLNALALIMWSGGYEIWRATGGASSALALPKFSTLLIAATLFYYSASRLPGGSAFWQRPVVMPLVFLPALVVAISTDLPAAAAARQLTPFVFESWDRFWQADGGVPLLLLSVYLVGTVAVLTRRYGAAAPGPERNLPRHLLLAVSGPITFMMLFSLVTMLGPLPMVLSASLIMAIIAQLGLLVVIRQEETERPLYLSRWIFYSIAVLIGFFISHLLFTLYESLTATVLLVREIRMMVLTTIAVVLLMASIPAVQTFFDRMLFRRAWEYRNLVREAQQELAETRQRLRRAERLSVVGEMAARIAHEIKNPLGPIKGYTQMMREKLSAMDDLPQREAFLRHLAVIGEEVENIDRKVHHLLDLSRKPDMTVAEEDLNRIVERAATLLRLESETAGGTPGSRVRVVEDLAPDLPPVVCNRSRIEEALFNICRNAFEACSDGGTVTLRTRAEQASGGRAGVSILVEDDGPGFSEAAREHLFEPFFTEKSDGTGLGLSIVKNHVDLHGGSVTFSSPSRGGTVAAIWLPLEAKIPSTDWHLIDRGGAGSPPEESRKDQHAASPTS